MPERCDYDEWLARYPERAPGSDGLPVRSTRRKVRIFLDEDVDGLVASLAGRSRLRVAMRCPKAASDERVWQIAQQRNLAIVTGNTHDFCNERRFPLARSPGVVALGGTNLTERLRSLDHIVRKSWLLEDVGAHPLAPRYTRTRAFPDGSTIMTEFWDATNQIIVVVDHTR